MKIEQPFPKLGAHHLERRLDAHHDRRDPAKLAAPRPRPLCLECMSRICHHFDARPYHLSPRQVEMVRLLTGGLSNDEIATAMQLTEGTVKVYFAKIFPALGLTSRLEVALWGLKHAELLAQK